MKKIIQIVWLLPVVALANNYSEIFPRENKICKEVIASCSFDEEKMCKKEICTYDKTSELLEKFLNEKEIIGRSFDNLIDMQDFVTKNIPKELKKYKLVYTSDENLGGYQYSIVFKISKNYRILDVKIY